jgi:hypothetical protein
MPESEERKARSDDESKMRLVGYTKVPPEPISLSTVEAARQPERVMTKIRVFISHSSKDKELAGALAELFRAALGMSPDEIRCTSVDGYRLEAGAETDDELQRETQEAETCIGIITAASIESAYVLFELGARWGTGKHLAPVLGGNADSSYLRGPLAKYNALQCDNGSQVGQLVENIGKRLGLIPHRASTYFSHIQNVVEASQHLAAGVDAQKKTPIDDLGDDSLEGLSKQAINILQQIVRSGEKKVMTIRGGDGELLYCLAKDPQLECDDPDSVDEDFEALVEAEFLKADYSGDDLCYRVTRKGTGFAKAKAPPVKPETASMEIFARLSIAKTINYEEIRLQVWIHNAAATRSADEVFVQYTIPQSIMIPGIAREVWRETTSAYGGYAVSAIGPIHPKKMEPLFNAQLGYIAQGKQHFTEGEFQFRVFVRNEPEKKYSLHVSEKDIGGPDVKAEVVS